MATQTEIVAKLNEANATLQKIAAETQSLQTKIGELQAIIDGMGDDASPELVAAVESLTAQVKTIDALVPDIAP